MRQSSNPKSTIGFDSFVRLCDIPFRVLSACSVTFYGIFSIQRLCSACFAELLGMVAIERLPFAVLFHLVGHHRPFCYGALLLAGKLLLLRRDP